MDLTADLNETDIKFLLALEELSKIFNEGEEPHCSACGKLILKLRQHVQKTHAHGHDPERRKTKDITESIPQFVSTRNLRTRKQRINYSENAPAENKHIQKPIRIQKSKAKPNIHVLPSTSSIVGDMSNPEIKIEGMDTDLELETDFNDYPEFDGTDDNEEETKIDINYLTGLDSVITTTVPDNTVVPIPESSYNHRQPDTDDSTCSICNKVYRGKQIIKHLRRGHNPGDLSPIGITEIATHDCDLCPKIFCSPEYLSYHFKSCHEEKTTKEYPCRICDEIFDGTKELNLHFQQCHPDEKRYNCTICEKQFSLECMLKYHTRLHTGEKPFPCDLCTKSFSTKVLLKRHKAVHAKPLICEVCGKGYSKQIYLDVHKRAKHTGERPFICKVCGKGFTGSNNLHLHMTKHTNEKKIVCDACGKCFKSKNSLNTHLIIHTGEKAFVCDYCGKSFFYKTELQSHSLVHTGETPFVCKLCGKSYKGKKSLIIHERTHTGEKPFVCELCDKCFSSKRMLIQHRKRHGDARPYVCPTCNKGFKTYEYLRRHKKNHTRENS